MLIETEYTYAILDLKQALKIETDSNTKNDFRRSYYIFRA